MDELTIDGKTYVSSKRAAAITGYAKDYVGQLCREGRVEARLVGRSWYVYEPSIRQHRFEEQGEEPAIGNNNVLTPEEKTPEKAEEKDADSSEKTNIQAVWETPIYESEEHAELILSEQDSVQAEEKSEVSSPEEGSQSVEEIESAWQSWFKEGANTPIEEPNHAEQLNHKEEEVLKEEVPVRVIRPVEERRVEYVNLPRVQEITPQKPVYAPPAVSTVARGRKIAKARSYLAVKASLVGVMILSIALAFLGSGIVRAVPQNIVRDISFIQYFEGISWIKKTAE